MAAAAFRPILLALACAACTTVLADERTFDGTRWHIAAIDARPTPASGDYSFQFSGQAISGRFGCNGFGGRYAIIGDIMTAGDIRSTLMACSEPAASFESEGFAVLRLPMRMAWTGGNSLSLTNSAGSITLQRAQ